MFHRTGLATFLTMLPSVAMPATTKTFIDYFLPIPVTCPLVTNAWGCTASGSTPANCTAGSGVLPRDTCNGIESPKNPPSNYYWDGSIVKANGAYHMFSTRWPGSSGFNPGWLSSDPIHAVGGTNPLGPYVDKGYAYSNSAFGSDQHHGHNLQVVTLLDGTYAMVVSEVVAWTIFTSSSVDGPWKPCSGSPGPGLSVPSSGFGGNNSYASNVSIVVRPDGNFESIQRHGLIALSTTGVCGPYKAQQPTNTYASSDAVPAASSASIFPNRKKHLDPLGPSTVEGTYSVAEDPVIWYSSGLYHVLYDYPGDRVGYHLTSVDGIHNWTDRGFAYDPRNAQKIFSYSNGTVNHWFKMERPSVLLQNGLITHVTFAVADVNKDNQIPAGSNHGSKVIVIPFDGVAFDKDFGVISTGIADGAQTATASHQSIVSREGYYVLDYSGFAPGKIDFELYSTKGARVASRSVSISESSGSFGWSELSSLPRGIYLVRVKAGMKTTEGGTFFKS
jgi:hypothetical protein